MTSIVSWDMAMVQTLYAIRTPLGVDVFSFITSFGGAAVVIAVLLASLFALSHSSRWPYAVGMLVALCGSMAFAEFLKMLVARTRPPLYMHAVFEVGYSFPSNHATAAMALYGSLCYAAWNIAPDKHRSLWILFFCVIIFLVGFSRVYLGVHYPSDVLAGYVIGFAFTWLGARTTRKLSPLTK